MPLQHGFSADRKLSMAFAEVCPQGMVVYGMSDSFMVRLACPLGLLESVDSSL